jgi:hypothetical protein
MNPVIMFSIGIALTMALVFLALWYLRNPLQVVLTDLCGTVERARFWTAFCNVTLFLIPFALALNNKPPLVDTQSMIFAISDQLEAAIGGLIIAIVILGIILSWHIARFPVRRATRRPDEADGAL